VSTIEELLGRNSSGSCLENREYGRGDPLRWPRDTLYPQTFALTSPTCGGRSVGIVRLRAKTMEFVCLLMVMNGESNWEVRGRGLFLFYHSIGESEGNYSKPQRVRYSSPDSNKVPLK
jgi:hypothetical protein